MKTAARRSDSLNLVEIARRFPDDATARAFLEGLRWPNGPECPHCGSVDNAHKIPANVAKKVRAGLYLCRDKACHKQFTVTVGTVFESSKIGLSNWLIAWHLVCSSKNGIAALELQRLLGIGSYRTAWFMLMRIRESLKSGAFDGSPLKGTVEVDEAHIGGKGPAGKGKNARKASIVTAISRDGAAVSVVVPDVKAASVAPVVAATVDPSANLVTDAAHMYRAIGSGFASHEAVNHTKREYVRGSAYTATVDSFFGQVKKSISGTHHSVSKKYAQRYLNEFDFRYTRRHVTDGRRSLRALEQTAGKRLKLHTLKAKG